MRRSRNLDHFGMALVLLVAFSRPGVSVSAVRGRSFCPSSDQQPSAKKGQDRGKFINYARQPFAAAQIQSVTFTLTLSACFLFYINLACKWWAFIAVHIYFMRILAHVFGPIWSVCLARSGSYLWLDLVRDFGLIWPMSLAWFGPCLWTDLACDFGLIWPMCCCLIWPVILAWFGPCFWPDLMICRSQATPNIVASLRPSLTSIFTLAKWFL